MSNIKDSYVFVESKSQDYLYWYQGWKVAGVFMAWKSFLGEETEDGHMPFKFEFDIVDNNSVPRENLGMIG